jgi:uncharacterized protein YaeQ
VRIRCDLFLNGGHRRLLLVSQPQETLEHLALKLSAFLLFWDHDPSVEISLRHPALAGQEFRPDLAAFDVGGGIALWVECGNVALHKLGKLARRYPEARLAVVKASRAEAVKLRQDLEDEERAARIEIISWPQGAFAQWTRALSETVHVVGEASGLSLNLVLNETPVAVDLHAD